MSKDLTDLQLLTELEPVVEQNINRHMRMRKDWNPHDYIPWSDGKNYYALGGQDWDPEQSKLSEVARVAMLVNLLTEDNLPSYHREIAMNFGMDGPWGFWVNRWTTEENRHGIALRDYLVVTRSVDPVELEQLRIEQMTRGFSPGQNDQIEADLFADSLFDSVIYVTFQELATRVSHRNTGKACNEPVADQLLQRVSADENLHMIFYRDVSEAGFEIAPNQAMKSLHKVLRNFKMPGYTIPDFRRRAVTIASGGVYDPRIHLEDIVMPVLKKWRIFERDDFNGESARMRDDLSVLVTELQEAVDKFEIAKQRRAERLVQIAEKKAAKNLFGVDISVETPVVDTARSALRIGPIALRSPVVLAPMAGVTNVAFRTLCRELELARAGTVSGLYVCEMVTARALVERHPVTMHMTTFAPDESPRSLQLYAVDPDNTYSAAKMIADDGMADHIDMNFGCPVPKVTRRGGGAALPFKRRLFGQIVAAAVRATEGTDIPVTVKFRIGIDDDHHTHLDAGRIAAEEGAAAVALHARTAAQRYSGTADWDQIAALKAHVTGIPVLGNGDIFDARDALAMMATTGCDGVVIGRGCLGRPWLFAELSAAFTGASPASPPTLGEVATIIRRHGELLTAHFGEDKGMRDIRKHVAWYLHGFPAGADLRRSMALVKTISELDDLLEQLDPDVAFPPTAGGPRGRQGSAGSVTLPEGWLNDPDDCTVPAGADVMNSGG